MHCDDYCFTPLLEVPDVEWFGPACIGDEKTKKAAEARKKAMRTADEDKARSMMIIFLVLFAHLSLIMEYCARAKNRR